MSATILLVRHAAHLELGELLSGRRRDVGLSDDGLEQAAIVGDLLGTLPIAAVYSSPRERAWDTANAIAEPHQLAVNVIDALDEIDFGQWTGARFSELEGDEDWQRWNEERGSARCPGGESMAEAAARATAALEEIANSHDGETVAAVTHCDIIRGALAHYLGMPLDNVLRFDVDPASVSTLALGRWGARIGSINERLYQ
ncbi:MAG: histidine phosphatase family protein [Sphingomicrobium sp.]